MNGARASIKGKEAKINECIKSLNWWAKKLNVAGISIMAEDDFLISECNRILEIVWYHDYPGKMESDWAKLGMRCYEAKSLAYDLKELKGVE